MADLVDTNVISEPRRPRPEPKVLAYFERRAAEHMFVSTVTLAELSFGVSIEPSPEKRIILDLWIRGTVRPYFAGRILEVSEAVILRWRILEAQGRRRGRTYSQPDLFLAATALEHNLTLVTRNTRDFADIPGIQLLNPWEPTA